MTGIVRCCPLEHAPGVPQPARLVTVLAPPIVEGEAGAPATVESLPGRRAAGGRPQGRP